MASNNVKEKLVSVQARVPYKIGKRWKNFVKSEDEKSKAKTGDKLTESKILKDLIVAHMDFMKFEIK
jgi:hypothetical protein